MADVYQDLLKDTSESFEDGNYFLLTITELELGTTYPLEFRWKYKDGTVGKDWSAVYNLSTPIRTVPNEPRLLTTDVVGGAGFIKVNWSGNDASGNPLENIDRVDIHISGTSFGDGTKPSGSFKIAGTQTFAAEPGVYIVQLKTITVNGESSFFSDARTVTVTAVGEVVQTPTLPSGLSVATAPFAVTVNWSGTYSASSFTGFKSIDIYAVSSDLGSSITSGITSTNLVGSLTVNDTPNKINISLDNLRQALSLSTNSDVYSASIFYYYNATNKDGTKYGSPTYTRINSSSVVPTKANFIDLASGVISIENLVAGNGNFSSWLRTGTAGGARIELSAVSDFSNSGNTVQKGLTAYSSGNSEIFKLDLDSGALTINGSGTFSGNLSAAGGTFTGTLSAATGSFSGTITASGGTIGGITIAAAALQNNSVESSSTFKLDSAGKARFGAFSGSSIIINPAGNVGSAYIYHSDNGGSTASGKFTVRNDGVLIATGAQISGTITASALDTTSLDIASDGTITTSSGNFGVTSSGVLSATGATLTNGSLTITSGTKTTTIGSNAIISLVDTGTDFLSGGGLSISASGGSGVYSATALSFTRSGSTGALIMNPSDLRITAGSASSVTITADDGLNRAAYPIQLNGHLSVLYNITANGSATFGSVGSQFEFLASSGNVRVAQTYNNVVSAGPPRAMYVNSNGLYGYISSTIRHKENVQDYLVDENSLMSLNLKSFNYKSDEEKTVHYGFIAEQAESLGLDELIQLNPEGLPEYFDYSRLSVFLFQVVKNQKNRIESLEQRLDALEG